MTLILSLLEVGRLGVRTVRHSVRRRYAGAAAKSIELRSRLSRRSGRGEQGQGTVAGRGHRDQPAARRLVLPARGLLRRRRAPPSEDPGTPRRIGLGSLARGLLPAPDLEPESPDRHRGRPAPGGDGSRARPGGLSVRRRRAALGTARKPEAPRGDRRRSCARTCISITAAASPRADGGAAFENAALWIGRADWERFVVGREGSMTDAVRAVLEERFRQGRVELLEGDRAIASGVTALATPGHTPGHYSVVVSAGTERAFILGDAVTCPAQLALTEWHALSDVDPTSRRARERAGSASSRAGAPWRPAATSRGSSSGGSSEGRPAEPGDRSPVLRSRSRDSLPVGLRVGWGHLLLSSRRLGLRGRTRRIGTGRPAGFRRQGPYRQKLIEEQHYAPA